MVYSDLLFILGILPISILASFFDRSTEYKNLILVLTSLIFFSWGKPFAVCLLFLTAIIEWLLGLWIDKINAKDRKGFLPLIIDIAMNTAVLLIMTKKFLCIGEDAFGFGEIIIPISVSFYVIRGFVYVYDIFKGNIKAEKNVFCLLTYMCTYFFLPTGPVTRYGKIESQIRKRNFTLNKISNGLTAFVCGLSKAVIIAPALKAVGEAGLNSENLTAIGCWAGMSAMLGFLYFLFTGFCDISLGLGRIYGFEFERNYKGLSAKGLYCGILKNINHSLTDFFEEVANGHKLFAPVFALIAVFLFGCSNNFNMAAIIAVGLTAGIIIFFEKTLFKGFFEKAPTVLRLIVTYLLTMIVSGGLMFNSLGEYKNWLMGLIGIGTKGIMGGDMKTALLNNIFVIIAALLLLCTPFVNKIKTKTTEYSMKSIEKYGRISIIKTILTALLLTLCIITIVSANVRL